ncbi:hypothetical protein HAX54_006322 [Datura stramonium]|uniref:Uncharacterized protein n=1 Tax=Datura stramonium TaxID=4076 RepID=A0ABS8TA33_DATST|nr:hypothetical protein [Datura stramonium]
MNVLASQVAAQPLTKETNVSPPQAIMDEGIFGWEMEKEIVEETRLPLAGNATECRTNWEAIDDLLAKHRLHFANLQWVTESIQCTSEFKVMSSVDTSANRWLSRRSPENHRLCSMNHRLNREFDCTILNSVKNPQFISASRFKNGDPPVGHRWLWSLRSQLIIPVTHRGFAIPHLPFADGSLVSPESLLLLI